jgi:isopenicillin N synthase-like dioxygenase
MSSRGRIDAIDFPGDPEHDDPAVASAMDDALARTGFMALSVPGLDARGTARVRAAAAAFFARPLAEKQRFAYRDTTENFGYQWVGTEALDPSAPPDLKESFTMRDLGRHAAETALFPDAEFRAAALELHGRLTAAARAVMHHLALNLEVDRDYFVRGHSGTNMTLRFLHYPAAPTLPDAENGQLGAGAHTDYGSFTLLLQDDVGGLQIHRNDRWEDVPPETDRVVVNTGDLMTHWSNDRYRSTWHRVQPVPRERFSIAFFVDPDDDTEVQCLPSCTRNAPARYADTTAGEHILGKLDASQPDARV